MPLHKNFDQTSIGEHWDDLKQIVDELIGGREGVSSGRLLGLPAWVVGGKAFAAVDGRGLAVKLPPERVRELGGPGDAGPFQPYGMPPLKEWSHIRREKAAEYRADLALLEEARRSALL